MNSSLKKYMWVGVGFVIVSGTLAHFVYEWTGENKIVGLFTPVNESTWEHMKLVFFPMVIYGALVGAMLSKEYPSFWASFCAGIISGTWLIPFLFYGYTGIIGRNMFILDLAVFVLSVFVAFWLTYCLILMKFCVKQKNIRMIIILSVIIMAVCFMIASYSALGIGVFEVK